MESSQETKQKENIETEPEVDLGVTEAKGVRLEFLEKWLCSLDDKILWLLYERSKKMTPEQRVEKKKLMADMEELHEAHMMELPKRLRYIAPSKGMVGAGAKMLRDSRAAGKDKEVVSFNKPEKKKSILDL